MIYVNTKCIYYLILICEGRIVLFRKKIVLRYQVICSTFTDLYVLSADIASELADYGAFIVPHQSASFRYSGTQLYQRLEKGRGVDFERQTGLEMVGGAGIDTAFYQDKWKDVAPLCEIVCIEFAECRERMKAERDRIAARPMPQIMRQAEQLALL